MIKNNIYDFIVGRVSFPLSNFLFNRKNILSNYHLLINSDKYNQKELLKLQYSKLRNVIDYSYNNIPFYKNLFSKIGLLPGDIKSIDDIRKIPPLSRDDVIENHVDMVDIRLKSSIQKANRVTKGPGFPLFLSVLRIRIWNS